MEFNNEINKYEFFIFNNYLLLEEINVYFQH